MKKNGFAMIEVLTIFIILGIFASVIVPYLINLKKKTEKEIYCNTITLIENKAIIFALNKEDIPNVDAKPYLKVKDLVAKGLIKSSSLGKDIDEDLDVFVYKEQENIVAKIKALKEVCD